MTATTTAAEGGATSTARATLLDKFLAAHSETIKKYGESAVVNAETATVDVGNDMFYQTLPEGVSAEQADKIAEHLKTTVSLSALAGKDKALKFLQENESADSVTITAGLGSFGNTSLLIKRSETNPENDTVTYGPSTAKVAIDARNATSGVFAQVRKAINAEAAALFGAGA